jgi:dihydroneopterin aldolase
MTGLLVSVRDAEEAHDAVETGADLIDIKEPRAGSLGAAAPETITEIVRIVAGRCPLSVALGELAEQSRICIPLGVQFAKLGLAGVVRQAFQPDRLRRLTPRGSSCAWCDNWREAIDQFPAETSPVAVVYADFKIAEAPSPEEVIECGRQLGCRAMLIDTFDKHGPGLLGNLSIGEIECLVTAARSANMLIVLGGQISANQLPNLLPLAPDYIAVRGAVCRGDRAARLDPQRVSRFVRRLRHAHASPTR